jgi:hypothetical protein
VTTHGYAATREAAMAAFARGCTHQARCYVRYRGQPGKHVLAASISQFEPICDMDGSGFLQCIFAAPPPHFARHPFLF